MKRNEVKFLIEKMQLNKNEDEIEIENDPQNFVFKNSRDSPLDP